MASSETGFLKLYTRAELRNEIVDWVLDVNLLGIILVYSVPVATNQQLSKAIDISF